MGCVRETTQIEKEKKKKEKKKNRKKNSTRCVIETSQRKVKPSWDV